MNTKEVLFDKHNKTEYFLRVLLQEQDWDSVYWDYLQELNNRFINKGYIYPSEYKKLESWVKSLTF